MNSSEIESYCSKNSNNAKENLRSDRSECEVKWMVYNWLNSGGHKSNVPSAPQCLFATSKSKFASVPNIRRAKVLIMPGGVRWFEWRTATERRPTCDTEAIWNNRPKRSTDSPPCKPSQDLCVGDAGRSCVCDIHICASVSCVCAPRSSPPTTVQAPQPSLSSDTRHRACCGTTDADASRIYQQGRNWSSLSGNLSFYAKLYRLFIYCNNERNFSNEKIILRPSSDSSSEILSSILIFDWFHYCRIEIGIYS